ncbi:MFS transporter [uncultured Adlercreutzia sp.]|uniref:MFS transporter n=1 Tax=uncultured Adlercreutzia sp. TaxID=875803 RepID=UPI0026F404BE|nr:MFS transporter [uncultured Adlercreutzia sp.]
MVPNRTEPAAPAPRPLHIGAPVAPRYLLSCALSLLGNSVAGVILPLILLATTGDPLAAGTLALICAAPQMIIGLVGGALIDRLNRRNVSIVSDIMSAASVAVLPVVDMIWGLNFGWFVVLGLVGAIGDIPGMTARDALLPAVCERDDKSLQKFMGLTQSLDSLTVIAGPALAAFLMAVIGNASALWFTAAMSFAAALVTLTLPHSIGRTGASDAVEKKPAVSHGLVRDAVGSLKSGVRVLFKSDALLRASMLLTFGIVMIMGSFQGLVLPVHFTNLGQPELLGFVLSAMSAGMLVSSLLYSATAHKLRRRTWFTLSLAGMAAGLLTLGLLPDFPVMVGGAVLLGLSAGPASALMGFFVFDRIPAENRGAALGTQNSLMLVAAPVAVFAASVVTEAFGPAVAGVALIACWMAVTVWALNAHSLKDLGDAERPFPAPVPLNDRCCD